MDKAQAKREAKTAGLYMAIEGLTNRLENDITDAVEAQAYQQEINRLIAQLRKVA